MALARLACTFVVALLALVTPAFASAADPDFEARTFIATPNSLGDVQLDLTLPAENPAAAKVVIYVPQGYGLNLAAAVGTKVGTIDATASAGGSALTIPTGDVIADSPANYIAQPQAQACAPGAHAAVWVAKAGNFTIPIYVDPTSGADAAIGAYKLQTCLSSPDIPESAGGAPFGTRLTEAEIELNRTVLTNPASVNTYLWRVFVTPYLPGTGTPNATGTYELRSLVFIPATLTLKKKSYAKKTKTVVLTGKFLVLGKPLIGATVFVFTITAQNVKVVGHARTSKKGLYTLKLRMTKSTIFAALVVGPTTNCEATPTSVAPAGCVHDTYSSIFSNPLRVAPT